MDIASNLIDAGLGLKPTGDGELVARIEVVDAIEALDDARDYELPAAWHVELDAHLAQGSESKSIDGAWLARIAEWTATGSAPNPFGLLYAASRRRFGAQHDAIQARAYAAFLDRKPSLGLTSWSVYHGRKIMQVWYRGDNAPGHVEDNLLAALPEDCELTPRAKQIGTGDDASLFALIVGPYDSPRKSSAPLHDWS